MKYLVMLSIMLSSVSCGERKSVSASELREAKLIALVKVMQKRQDRINAYLKKLQKSAPRQVVPQIKPSQKIARR